MREKKDIDRLFQEKFKDFEAAPPERVWGNIEAELRKEKKRRVVPLWFKLGSVAAILVIALLLSLPVFNDFDSTKNPVVIDDNASPVNSDGSPRISPTRNPVHENQTVTDLENTGQTQRSGDSTVTPAEINNTHNSNNTEFNSTQKNSSNSIAYDNTSAHTPKSRSKNLKNTGNTTTGSAADAVVYSKGNGVAIKNNTATANGNIAKGNTSNSGNDNNQVDSSPENVHNNASGGIAVTEIDALATGADNTKKNTDTAIDPITNNISSEAVAEAVVDTVAVPAENELEKLLKEKLLAEKDKTAVAEDNKMQKWNVKPQMAPVFYNSLSQGSPINPQLAANSKSYDNDMSYGLGLNYAVSSRITIRSGVNTVNLKYSTNGIQFYAALNDHTDNVVSSARIANIVVENPQARTINSFAADQLPTQKFNGSMIQKMGFIEVPLEMSYKLLNKKFGIDIIGGLSTLFLNQNNVSVVSSQGYTSDMGEASNLNNIHFSTNVGLGFKYRFFKSFEANFEPMFKYQINTFSSDAGNFKPYFIGLYSGISFSF